MCLNTGEEIQICDMKFKDTKKTTETKKKEEKRSQRKEK